jgi:SNF2 family DNA or RNA helicase
MLTPYHAKYFAHELTKKSSSDSIQKLVASLMDAQVDLNPHQVEAALFAFRTPLSKGAILADEVGLGKTIEAGLVISQKWAERKRKILIIVPSNLRKQWYQELADKFFLPSVILETKSFNDGIKKGNYNPFTQSSIIICSYQFACGKEAYIKGIEWDLVVVDEAHRLRNVYKPNNKIANSIKNSIANAPKILLTATPLQNSLLELYGLVSIIDDYAFGDLGSFRNRYTRLVEEEENYSELKFRLQPICKRTLRRQVYEYVKYTERKAITQQFSPSDEEHRLYDLVSDYLQNDKLYALPPSQRHLMTLILRKLLASSTYAIAGTLEALSKKLETIVDGNDNQDLFDQKLIEDYESYEEEKDEWSDEEEEETQPARIFSPEEIEEIKQELKKLKEFLVLANSIQKNSKGEVLLTALEKGFESSVSKGANKKAIIFTESTRTQKYLFELLQNTQYAGKVVLFNGSNTDPLSKQIYTAWNEKYEGTDKTSGSKTADTRAAIVEYFRDEAEIMIATEAAAEGINLQFCSFVVNYDLPWNPQRIEQRIGRCHRYGQKYDVVVVNFLNIRNAADQRVYKLLDEKFKLFSGVFGASDEILGAIESGVDFEKRIAQIYQKCRTEQEIQQSFDQLQKDMESQISETLQNTRQKLLENFDQEVIEKLKIRDAESKEYLNIYLDWLWKITKFYLEPFAKFNHTELSFYLVNNPFPQEKIHSGPYKIGRNIDDANIYRIGHPLAQRIIEECKTFSTPVAELIFDYTNNPLIKVAILEELVGKSGWLKIVSLTICSFECEEVILFTGVTDSYQILDSEQCKRLFSLPAITTPSIDVTDDFSDALSDNFTERKNELLNLMEEKNKNYFVEESDKLGKWAEDIITAAETDIKKTKTRIRELNRLLRVASSPNEILEMQKELQELESKKRKQRQRVFDVEDEIEKKRDEIIMQLELRMKQSISQKELFTIRWKLI